VEVRETVMEVGSGSEGKVGFALLLPWHQREGERERARA
jgi:hypothetical protein